MEGGGAASSDDEEGSSLSSSSSSMDASGNPGAQLGTGAAAGGGGAAPSTARSIQSSALCIGDIEAELHQTFAAARRPPQYVFAVEATAGPARGANSGELEGPGGGPAANRYFQALTEHCDIGSLQYSCPPLVLYGPSGVGKSSILSNWLAQQRALQEDGRLPVVAAAAATAMGTAAAISTSSKSSSTSSSSRRMACLARREFVFWHAAGSSRTSCLTTHLLRRLQTELRAFFELKKEVAADDQRLRWDLPVFLELAARKGSVLIVIDGVHRMRDEDGSEDLKWLPASYPPYVRLIVSTTVYGPEAQRPPTAPVPSASLQDREDEGGPGPSAASASSSSMDDAAQQQHQQRAGLRNDSLLVGSWRDPRRAYTNKALHELRRRGWEMLQVAEMSPSMCQHVLLSFGRAEPASAAATDRPSPPAPAPALRLFPSQYQAILANAATRNPLFLRLLLQALRWSARQRGFDVWRLLPHWLEARSVVELYHRVLETWERGLAVSPATQAEALERARREGGGDALQWERQRQPQHRQGTGGGGGGGTSPSLLPPAALDAMVTAVGGQAGSQQQAKEVAGELPLAEIQWRKVHADADRAIEDARAAVERAAARAMAEGLEAAARASKPLPADSAQALAAGLLFRNEPLVEFFAGRQGRAQQAERRETMMAMAMAGRSSMRVSAIRTMADAAPPPPTDATLPEEEEDEDGSSTSTSGGSAADSSAADRSSSATSTGDGGNDDTVSSPSIPLAFRGGADEEGVGGVLGHALAALYVARHGLTVTELMHLLATLREREDRRFWARAWERREALAAAFSEADATDDGVLPLPAFEAILQQHGLDLKPHDLFRLLHAADARAPEDDEPAVLYRVLLEHCGAEQQRQQQQASSGGEAADRPSIPPPLLPKLSSSASRPAHDAPREPRRAVRHPLGEETEAALLQMLVALGVLLVHDGDVLVLPLEAETLREAIRARYIDAGGTDGMVAGFGVGAGGGGGEELWHKAIIHYFQSQPSGLLRRCEELPWHLQVCRHWLALRDFLVDLRAFRAMYGGRLKHELFEYWRLLTEGPLVLPGIPVAAVVEGALLNNAPALADSVEPGCGVASAAVVLSSQDVGSPPSSPWRRGRLAPFDIVECYNTAVEEWKEGRGKPSIKQLAEALWLIAKFLAEFADVGRFHETLPRYLRKPLHPELMDMMGLAPTAAAVAPTVAGGAAGAPDGDGLPVQIDRASFRSKLFLLPPEQDAGAATDDESEEDEDGEGDDASSTASSAVSKPAGSAANEEDEEEQRQRREQEEAEAVQRANAALIAHDTSHYYLKRWVWMQFPWLVLANTTLALQLFLGSPEEATPPPAASAQISTVALPSSPLPTSPSPTRRRLAHRRVTSVDGPFRRLWAVKKVDPSRVVSGSSSDAHVLRTMVQSSVLHIAPHAETAERLARAICAEDRVMSKKEEDDDALLHAAPGQEARAAAAAAEQEDDAAHTLLLSTGLPVTLCEKRLTECNKRVARLRSILDRVVEDRALMAAQLERLARAATVRDQHDRAILEGIQEGELMIEALALRLRRLQDANTEAAALTAYYKLIIVQCLEKNPVKDTKRVESVERQVALASFQLRSLIHQRDRVAGEHVAIEEEEIPKAHAQLEQVRQERARVRERLALFRRRGPLNGSTGLPSGNSQALMAMLTTTTLFLKGVLPAHGPARKEPQPAQLLSPAISADNPSPPPPPPPRHTTPVSTQEQPPAAADGSNISSTAEVPAAPKLTPYQSVFAASRAQRLCAGIERLFELSDVDNLCEPRGSSTTSSNSSSMEDGAPTPVPAPEAAGKIVHKFKNVHKLNKSFLGECRELEARIAELRGALQAQERRAAASSIDKRPVRDGSGGGGSAGTDGESTSVEHLPHREPGELEALIHEEEQRCARYRAMKTNAHKMLDRVKAGINHLARLVARHSKALPLASLRSKDGQHEDKYEDADLYKVLSTFDERIASIQEIVVLEANEMADGAIKKFATTAAASAAAAGAAGGGGGGAAAKKPKDHEGIDALFLPLLDESTSSQTGVPARRRAVTPGPEGKLEAVGDLDPEELVGIDPDVVLFFKGEAYSRERNALFSYAPPPEEAGGYGDGSPYAPVWGSTNPLLRPTAKRQGPPALQRAALAGAQERVRVKALASAEQEYEESLRALRKRDDAMFEAREKEEEQQQVQVESTGETEGLLRSALFLDSPSHLQLRQLLKQEHDVDSRQYPHIHEGHGIAITKALEKTEMEVSVRALYGWEEREAGAARVGKGRGRSGGRVGGAARQSGGGGGSSSSVVGARAGPAGEGPARARARQPASKGGAAASDRARGQVGKGSKKEKE